MTKSMFGGRGATAEAAAKFGAEPATDLRPAKRGRFLEQRGFPDRLVRRYLGQSAALTAGGVVCGAPVSSVPPPVR